MQFALKSASEIEAIVAGTMFPSVGTARRRQLSCQLLAAGDDVETTLPVLLSTSESIEEGNFLRSLVAAAPIGGAGGLPSPPPGGGGLPSPPTPSGPARLAISTAVLDGSIATYHFPVQVAVVRARPPIPYNVRLDGLEVLDQASFLMEDGADPAGWYRGELPEPATGHTLTLVLSTEEAPQIEIYGAAATT